MNEHGDCAHGRHMPQDRRASRLCVHSHAARQSTAMPMAMANLQCAGPAVGSDLQGVIWGRRHLRVALEVHLAKDTKCAGPKPPKIRQQNSPHFPRGTGNRNPAPCRGVGWEHLGGTAVRACRAKRAGCKQTISVYGGNAGK